MTLPFAERPVTSLHLRLLLALPFLALAACERTTSGTGGEQRPPEAAVEAQAAAATAATAPASATTAAVPRPTARTATELNTTTPAQRAEAARPAAGAQRKLGDTVASLGDPTQPGFWIKTPLVNANGKGRIVNPANGKTAQVDLLPLSGSAGSGSQVSLPALQLIGVSLTDLPTIEVYQN